MVVTGVVVGVATGRSSPPGSRKTALDHLKQMPVLQGSLHTLFVIQLLVHGMLGLMRAFLDAKVNAVPRRQGAE